jgi:hypothetical protein
VVTGFPHWRLDAVWAAIPYVELIDIRTNAADKPHPAQGLKLQLEIGGIGGLEEVDARRRAEALPLALGAESYFTVIDPDLKAEGSGAVNPQHAPTSRRVGLDGLARTAVKPFFSFVPPVMATREKGASISALQPSPAYRSGMWPPSYRSFAMVGVVVIRKIRSGCGCGRWPDCYRPSAMYKWTRLIAYGMTMAYLYMRLTSDQLNPDHLRAMQVFWYFVVASWQVSYGLVYF